MRLDLSSLSDDALAVLATLFSEADPASVWLRRFLDTEHDARAVRSHAEPVLTPAEDSESVHYVLRHGGAVLEALIQQAKTERAETTLREASDFLAALIGQDLAMDGLPGSGKLPV